MSIRFQADNDLRFGIKAVRRREPAIDFVAAQEAGFDGVSDPEILERAASAGRVLVTHDRRTMISHFRIRLGAGISSPGILVVSQGAQIGEVVESIVYLWALADPYDLCNQVHYLPSMSRHVFGR